jgi:CheY-like chemotaxis protein
VPASRMPHLDGRTMEEKAAEPAYGAQARVGLVEADSVDHCAESPPALVRQPNCSHAPESESDPSKPILVTRKRLLVVEDNPDVAQMLSEVLQIYGYNTRVAYDGITALELAKSFRPDVALVDIGLPAMDGYQLARRFRQMPELRATRLFAVTGYGQLSDRMRSAQAGFERHLVKPVDLEELRRLIDGTG